ncbi:MAG: hypothetical protein RL329_550 [Bacteroidota bacterium]|jgi:hypothetical protein
MKHFLFKLFFLITFYSFLSCKEKDEAITPIVETIPAKAHWELHPATMGTYFIANQFYKDASQLMVIGNNYTLLLDTTHQVIAQKKFIALRNSNDLQPFVNKKFFVYADYERTTMTIYAREHPTIQKKIDISQFGPYGRIVNDGEPPCMITPDHKMFVPVEDAPNLNHLYYFLIFQLTLSADSIRYQFEGRMQIPTTPNQPFLGWSFTTMQQFDEPEIWATGMGRAYRLNLNNYTINNLYPMRYGKFGYIRDTLFSIGCETMPDGDAISYNYRPKGQTQWKSFTSTGFSASDMTWHFLENEILMVFQNQYLYHFTVDGNTIRLRRLHTESIEAIQDITYFQGRIYIASKQGLYSKRWKDFWTYL